MAASDVLPLIRRLALPAAVLAVVVALVVVARERLGSSPRFVVDPAWVQVLGGPDWMSPELRDAVAVEIASALPGPARLLGSGSLAEWRRELLGASPWIADVARVEPRFPSQADVDLVLRRPVLDLGAGRLLCADGLEVAAPAQAISPRPVAYAGRPPARGRVDEEVVECAAALGDLLPHRATLGEMGIELSTVRLDDSGLVVLGTAGGVQLDWGRSSRRGPVAAYDIPASGRIDNLAMVLDAHPGLAGVARVELWLDRPKVVPGP